MERLEGYRSVQKWRQEVDRLYRLSPQEWEGRLQALARFCQFVGEDPDTVIDRAKADQNAKLDYMRALRRLLAQSGLPPLEAHELENAVRSFFIHNGARVIVRPYPQE